ncbi:hypothetical protein [Streptomyces sp. S186]|uniref:hypothetical protein n=1 Tax=Streptomyces sp. S186 TaxID=3434395 RepID=UPI003F66933D
MSDAQFTYTVTTVPTPLGVTPKGSRNGVSSYLTVLVTPNAGKELSCSGLRFTFKEGRSEAELSKDLGSILPSVPHPPGVWQVEYVNKAFMVSPKDGLPVKVKDASISVEFDGVVVNTERGVTPLRIEEWTGETKTTEAPSATTQVPIVKYPSGFRFSDFYAARDENGTLVPSPVIELGNPVTLHWTASEGAKYELFWDGGPTGGEDVTLVRSKDLKEKQLLEKDTTFYLRATFTTSGHTVTHYLTTTVQVRAPRLQVTSVSTVQKGYLQTAELRTPGEGGTFFDEQAAVRVRDAQGKRFGRLEAGILGTEFVCAPVPSGDRPALAVYNDMLYCVFRGTGNDERLWYVTWSGNGWGAPARIRPGADSAAGPALAAHENKLFCLHRGFHEKKELWSTVWNGDEWTQDQHVPGVDNGLSPALASYDGKLFCVHRGGNDSHLWYTTREGNGWSKDTLMDDHASEHAPALVVFQQKLFCFHNSSDFSLKYRTWDGSHWSKPVLIPNVETMGAQGVAVYQDRLYCAHRGGGTDTSLWVTTWDGNTWTSDRKVFGPFYSATGAALAVFDNKLICAYGR